MDHQLSLTLCPNTVNLLKSWKDSLFFTLYVGNLPLKQDMSYVKPGYLSFESVELVNPGVMESCWVCIP